MAVGGLLTPWAVTVTEAGATRPVAERVAGGPPATASSAGRTAAETGRSAAADRRAAREGRTATGRGAAAHTGGTPPADVASETGGTTGAPAGSDTVSGTASGDDGGSGPASARSADGAPADSPLAGDLFYGTNAGAAAAAAQSGVSPGDAALLRELAQVPTATWLGQWSGDVASTVRRVVADARVAGRVPVFVAYNIPGRDCGGYSAGGVGSAATYAEWVEAIAAGIGSAEAVVVVEPDALAQLCGDQTARIEMLRSAVGLLERNPGTHTYLDAGHSQWVDPATMADRLRAAGAADADGFALNVSNFQTTASNVAYGQAVSALLGGAHFVIDTSRNGNGPGADWCNPPGRAVGERPTSATGHLRVDAFLWLKTPGESDGTCNGGPSAGTFWPAYAVALMRAA